MIYNYNNVFCSYELYEWINDAFKCWFGALEIFLIIIVNVKSCFAA